MNKTVARGALLVLVMLSACQDGDTADTDKATSSTAPDQVAGFVMRPLPPPSSLNTKIVGGKVAKREDYPATLKFDSGNCTATVIGSNAVLTAAHCISGSTGSIDLKPKRIALTCTIESHYPANTCPSSPLSAGCSSDIALCHSTTAIPLGGAKYEVVAADAAAIKEGTNARILGYGCTNPPNPGTNDLNEGDASIAKAYTDGGAGAAAFIYLKGGAAICPGDSGGGAFDSGDMKKRVVIGVNSASSVSTLETYLAPITGNNQAFIKKWSSDNKAPLCGLDAAAKNCAH